MNNFKFLKHVYFPFKENRRIGGPLTFMTNLHKWLIDSQLEYSTDINKAKAVFSPFFFQGNLEYLSSQGVKIILRLDGLYYFSRHGSAYKSKNTFFNMFYFKADCIIFQSLYSQSQFISNYGERDSSIYNVIYNGADSNIFYPSKAKDVEFRKIKFTTSGNFRHKDMIEPIVLALDKLYQTNKNFELRTIGPISDNSLQLYFERPYIKHYGKQTNSTIAKILRDSHIFLYTFLNTPCPNSVIEAISVGIPVVGYSTGSMPELLHFSKELLAKVSDKIFQTYDEYNTNLLLEKINLAINNYTEYRKRSLEYSSAYSFNTCATKYLNSIKILF